jgi:hypothetical protein
MVIFKFPPLIQSSTEHVKLLIEITIWIDQYFPNAQYIIYESPNDFHNRYIKFKSNKAALMFLLAFEGFTKLVVDKDHDGYTSSLQSCFDSIRDKIQ